jgi:ketosteroid isomerase-like protein
MNEENPNVQVLKDAYRRWHDTKAASVDHWLDLMTDDVHFSSLANGAQTMEFTRHRTSKEDVRGYFAHLTNDWEMIHYTVHEFIAQGDRVVALATVAFKNKKTGKTLATPKADFHKFRDGKICEFFEFYDTAQAIAMATPE